MIRHPSSDGVTVALHELAGSASLPTLLISHATGFHARCYVPIAELLGDRFHSFGLDFRGHGETELGRDVVIDWSRFGDDAIAVATELAEPIVGFGHSMGGAALLMAAHRDPARFERLVLFEPIVFEPAPAGLTHGEIGANPMVGAALRRRRTFASFDAAYDNFSDKPPMSVMTTAVLRNYVDHGFRTIVDDDGTAAVTLRCAPEVEAGIFLGARANGVWDLLPQIETPCVIVAGVVEVNQPSSRAHAIAERLPHASCVQLDHQTHFGPFSHPAEIADLIAG